MAVAEQVVRLSAFKYGRMLVLWGLTYTYRLWCIWELFTLTAYSCLVGSHVHFRLWCIWELFIRHARRLPLGLGLATLLGTTVLAGASSRCCCRAARGAAADAAARRSSRGVVCNVCVVLAMWSLRNNKRRQYGTHVSCAGHVQCFSAWDMCRHRASCCMHMFDP